MAVMDLGPHPLKLYRKHAGLSLRELAKRSDTSAQSIFRIEESLQIPSVDLIRRIIAAIPESGLTANDFVAHAPSRPSGGDAAEALAS